LEAACQPFAEGYESDFFHKTVNPCLKMQNIFFLELWGPGQGHLPSFLCEVMALVCLKLGLKAVLRDNFFTELNEKGSENLQVYAPEQL